MRDHALLLLAIALTSALALTAARRNGVAALRRAMLTAVEVLGATALFFVANVILGVTLVLAARRFTPLYPTLYEIADVILLILSLVQALILHAWLGSRRHAQREP